MIREYEFYHGAVLKYLLQGAQVVELRQFRGGHSYGAAYVVNEKVGLYIKHSTSRLSPWSFTFLKEHQDDIKNLKECFEYVFICLVCHDDGIVCLEYTELKYVLDQKYATEWVRVARRRREKYAVSGSDGRLKAKVGEKDFPAKIFLRL
jgi:hypothetical protein